MDKEFVNHVADILKIEPDRLKKDSTAQTIPEWDSLTHWAVIGELEDIYNVEFTMDEATSFKNLGDIFGTLENKTK